MTKFTQESRPLQPCSIYPVECYANGVFASVSVPVEPADAENQSRSRPRPKKCGPFSLVSSRYLDRGRVSIVGTEDGN